MKNKKIIIILIVLIFWLIIFATNSNAAIESKPGTTADTNKTITQFFEYCYKMRNQNSSLGGNTVDPHLATARDWGAVAYLGLSSYGTVRSTTGDKISIDSREYYTTTGNISGVMNFGYDPNKTGDLYTFVALRTGRGYYLAGIYDNYKKYIDYVREHTVSNTKGMAMREISIPSSWYGCTTTTSTPGSYDTFVRKNGVLGFSATYGDAGTNRTYRPAIWN